MAEIQAYRNRGIPAQALSAETHYDSKQQTGSTLTHSVQVELNGPALAPNRRMPLNLEWVERFAPTPARWSGAPTIGTRRTVKKEWQAAWLLRAIACHGLTTLSRDDTADRVRRLCAKARQPLARRAW